MDILEFVGKLGAVWFISGCGVMASCWPMNDKSVSKMYMFAGLAITFTICYFIIRG